MRGSLSGGRSTALGRRPGIIGCAVPVLGLLAAGLDQTVEAPFRRDSFGLHVDPEVSPDQLVEMGRRHGFRVPAGAAVRAGAAPTVYVELTGDTRLEEVLEAVLSSEASVRTVNLNYTEP